MSRLEAVAAWCLSCLGAVLLGGSIVSVPQNAFADAGGDCYNKCTAECGPELQCFYDCAGICCGQACEGEETCSNECCGSACPGDPSCAEECTALATATVICLKYSGDPDECKNNHTCLFRFPRQWYCDVQPLYICLCSKF